MSLGVYSAARALAGRARGGRAERHRRRGPPGGRQPQAPAAQGARASRAPAAPAAGRARRLQVMLPFMDFAGRGSRLGHGATINMAIFELVFIYILHYSTV